ncbi:hypothetical protein LTR70_010823, partial [Exophiala xenobiotica]
QAHLLPLFRATAPVAPMLHNGHETSERVGRRLRRIFCVRRSSRGSCALRINRSRHWRWSSCSAQEKRNTTEG